MTIYSQYILNASCKCYNKHKIFSDNKVHDYLTRNTGLYKMQRPKTEFYKKCPDYMMTKIWNHLSDDLKNSKNILLFKKRLKGTLLKCIIYDFEFFSTATVI